MPLRNTNKIVYVSRHCMPPMAYLGLCLSQASFDKEWKRLKMHGSSPRWVQAGAAGTTHTFTHSRNGEMCIVSLDIPKGKERGEIYGLIVHEAVHVMQTYRKQLNDPNPGIEFEAYSLQGIVQHLLYAFEQTLMEKKL